MNNTEIYNSAFIEVFPDEADKLNGEFGKESVEGWDSLRQLTLITKIEDSFDIMFDPEDIIGFDSYSKGIEILKKYNIEL